jgi:hypothetical protein
VRDTTRDSRANERDGELTGERPDLLEELDERTLGVGHEPDSTTRRASGLGAAGSTL